MKRERAKLVGRPVILWALVLLMALPTWHVLASGDENNPDAARRAAWTIPMGHYHRSLV